MATRLAKALKREIEVEGRPYTVTIATDGVTVVEKGKRKGQFVSWGAIVRGDARLAEDLRISLDATGGEA